VGLAHRRALERFTNDIPLSYNLLASAQAMVGGRTLGTCVGSIAAQVGSSRAHQAHRIDRRRHVFLGKKRGDLVGKTKRGTGTKTMVLIDAKGLPLAATIASASPHEVTLIEPLLDKQLLRRRVRRLIYDQAADSDPLRERLKRRGIELICPHRCNRIKPPTQDGRKLRRYARRWKVERSISWLQNFRRLVTRYEHYSHLFYGFVQLACLVIVLNRF
jgi:transposase